MTGLLVLPAGMMPTFMAPCSELAIQPMTPTHSACWETVSGDAPILGSQTTHRSTT